MKITSPEGSSEENRSVPNHPEAAFVRFASTRPAGRSYAHKNGAAMNAFIRKLEGFAPLDEHRKRVLVEVSSRPKTVENHVDIIVEGDRPHDVHLILDGLAYRYKLLPNGNRQILGFLLPGDFCDLHVALLEEMDHNIGTLAECQLVDIPRSTILELTERDTFISRALWWTSLVDEAILREWLVSMGQREAEQRIAHLFCELHLRLRLVGLASDDGFDFALSQQELGDTMGISVVHANRSLKALRDKHLVTFRSGRVDIHNLAGLRAYSGFRANYLHMENAPHSPRAANGRAYMRDRSA